MYPCLALGFGGGVPHALARADTRADARSRSRHERDRVRSLTADGDRKVHRQHQKAPARTILLNDKTFRPLYILFAPSWFLHNEDKPWDHRGILLLSPLAQDHNCASAILFPRHFENRDILKYIQATSMMYCTNWNRLFHEETLGAFCPKPCPFHRDKPIRLTTLEITVREKLSSSTILQEIFSN